MAAAAPNLLPTYTREQLIRLTTPRLNKFIPIKPHPKQAAFLLLNCREAFYGGAAGSGKTEALLAAATQYVDIPGYAALIIRGTIGQLGDPKSIMSKSMEWWAGTAAHWNGSKFQWIFPSGATINFKSMPNEMDYYKLGRGPEYQCICFDELTMFSETQYTFMFTRLRRRMGVTIPLRMRSASNPGDVGHAWVRQRFMEEGRAHGRAYVPARLDDNPSIDAQDYILSLNELDPITRAQMLHGDWTARVGGALFKREWFADRQQDGRSRVLDQFPAEVLQLMASPGKQCGNRYWDLAATPVNFDGRNDPDYTAGARTVMYKGELYVADITSTRATPLVVQTLTQKTAAADGRHCPVYIEQEPGASGVQVIDDYQRNVLTGYIVFGDRVTGDKVTRATLLSSMAEAGHVWLLRGPWLNQFLQQAEAFGLDVDHDDYIDAVAGSLNKQVAGKDKSFTVRPLEL